MLGGTEPICKRGVEQQHGLSWWQRGRNEGGDLLSGDGGSLVPAGGARAHRPGPARNDLSFLAIG